MPANGSITSSGLLDSTAVNLFPEFEQLQDSGSSGTSNFSGPYWQANEVRLRFGRKPSYALVSIPLTAVDETAPAVAAVGLSKQFQIGTYGKVSVRDSLAGGDALIFSGSITNILHNLRNDSIEIRLEDHRYLLAGFKIAGQLSIDGTAAIQWRSGWRCMMNPGGEPNCTLGTGTLPVFCHPKWGLTEGETPPETLTSGKASYWTIPRALLYLHYFYSNATDRTQFLWMGTIPSVIKWDEAYHSSIKDENIPTERKIASKDFEGMSLLDALQDLCEMAGHYALYMKPINNFDQSLQIVQTQYNPDGNPVDVYRATGGDAATTLDRNVVIEGTIEEDGSDLYTIVAIAGDLVYIERRLDGYSSELEKAWSDTDFEAWKDIVDGTTVISGIAAKTVAAFEAANAKYPRVLAAFRIKPTYDYQAGTTQSAYPRADISRPPLPQLLTNYLEDTASSDTSDKMSGQIPVIFEIKVGSTYYPYTYDDGFKIDSDGTFWLTGLRANGGGTQSTWSGNITAAAPSDITVNDIRATLAIPCDHRLVDAYKISSDAVLTGIKGVTQADDAENISTHLSRLYYADASELYKLHIREASFPLPAPYGGATQSGTLRDDTTLLQAHCKRRLADLGRVPRRGRLVYGHIYTALSPGYMLKDLVGVGGAAGTWALRACLIEVALRSSGRTNSTEMIMG